MTNLLSTAGDVVGRATSGEQLEAFVTRNSSTTVKAYNGEVESFTSAASAGIGIRVVVDGREGFAHAGSLDDDVIEETLAEARDNVRFGEPDEWVALAVPDGLTPIEHNHWNDSVASTSTADKVQMAIDLEARTISRDPRVTSVRTAIYSDHTVNVALATSTGISASDQGTGANVAVAALARDGDETKIAGGHDVAFGPDTLDLDVAANDAIERATRLLGATQPSSERLSIVFEPRMAASIVGLTVGMLNGSRKIKGRTPFLGREGEVIASPLLTVVDDPTDGRSFGASAVDGEGQTCRPTSLIEAGVLANFLHNTYTGRRSGDGTTANAVRGYSSSPGVGSHAVNIAPGDHSLEEMIEGLEFGLLVTSMSGLHSGFNAVSGDFSVGVEGLMIRNGALAEPIREATVASTIQKMLTEISAVGNDLEWLPSGTGTVSLQIDDVSLSGS